MIISAEFFDTLGKSGRIYRLSVWKINRFLKRTSKIEWDLENAEIKGQKEFHISNKRLIEHVRMKVLAEISTEMLDESIGMLTFTESECPLVYNLMTSGDKILPPKED